MKVGRRIPAALALVALVLCAGYDVDRHEQRIPAMDGVAMCDTDTDCEQVRLALCEAAMDDGETSEWCKP